MSHNDFASYTNKSLPGIRYVGPIRIEPRPDGGHDLVAPNGSVYPMESYFDEMAVTDMALFLAGSAAAKNTEYGK